MTSKKTVQKTTIPAKHAKAAHVKKGQKVRVINTHGTQVVDCWALNADNLTEYMSMEHCRVSLERYRPKKGDTMITNKRRAILKILEDSADGVHDTLLAACDRYRYELLGCQAYHRNCTDNFWEAMVAIGENPLNYRLRLIYGKTHPLKKKVMLLNQILRPPKKVTTSSSEQK